ncbi:MAG: phosphoribosylamine--glycine ligase [Bacteroidales bacterium]|jgi:phosphoribosylamine--glycine ligase|nr:phosphoribosylamine--glycine ligase [Bacteroidales bacterium]
MNVLVLGSGGREHAIAWKVKQSKNCTNLFCLPGNPGTAQIATNVAAGVKDFEAIKKCVLENNIEIVICGPEDPLVFGLKDMFAADEQLKDVLFVGPSKLGAQLEGSKDFAKEFMVRHNIPTAAYKSFTKETLTEADAFLEQLEAPYVLKADGLAAGKGVLILEDLEEAKAELRNMMGGKFGEAGNTVVIEQFLKGIEVSVFVLTSGKDYLILPEAKDYKRIGEGDKGLNTGGMGAVSPVVFADAEFMAKVEERIIKPTVEGFAKDNIDYKGFVFIGLMNCGGDPYVIEYNVRMGDPETEAVMTRIDSDLLSHLVAAAKGDLSGEKIEISKDGALTVVCVSGGYPEEYKKGLEMGGSEYLYSNTPCSKIKVFHAGTAMKDGKLVTSGGRVLAITVNGEGIEKQRETIYAEIAKIEYEGKYCRRDIGLDLLNYKG